MRYLIPTLVGILALAASATFAEEHGGSDEGELHTETIEYSDDGTTLQGYLAYDSAVEGPRPGVLVVHEWWGHNDYARRRARELAELGYTAFALDMYGKGKVTEHPDEAQAFMKKVNENRELMKRRFNAALGLLRGRDGVDGERIAAIGYCFGGGVVLNMARAGADLEAVASFHGTIPTDNPPDEGEVQAEVLVLNGGADPFVKDEQLETFREQMGAAGADFRIVSYPGVKHSFTNPAADEHAEEHDLPLAYDAEADRKSWNEMKALFERTLGGES